MIEAVFLAELAMALPFLEASPVFTDQDLAGLKTWFSAYLTWLTAPEDTGPRIAALARDMKDRHASSWLLQAAAAARWTANDAVTADCRHRFERVTLRAQVSATGSFPAELTTPNPYRNSLENLDLLAGACELLSTSFESVWNYELQDGPGMRAAMAHHVPFIQKRASWPYPPMQPTSATCRYAALPCSSPPAPTPAPSMPTFGAAPAGPSCLPILRMSPITPSPNPFPSASRIYG